MSNVVHTLAIWRRSGHSIALYVFWVIAITTAAVSFQFAAQAQPARAAKSVRVIYLLAADAARTDRAPLAAKIVEHNRARWAEYGRNFAPQPVETIRSQKTAAEYVSSRDLIILACQEVTRALSGQGPCGTQDSSKYVVFIEAQGLTDPNSDPVAYIGGRMVSIPSWIMDSAEKGMLRDVGSIGHELSHAFGKGREPQCDQEGQVKSIMCNGSYYPLNRINAIDYAYLLSPANDGYFDGGPEDLFDTAAGKALSGAPSNTIPGQTNFRQCAIDCLKDESCTAIVVGPQSCTFRSSRVSLRDATPSPGFTSGVVKVGRRALKPLFADGTIIRLKSDTGRYVSRCNGCQTPIRAGLGIEDTATIQGTDPNSPYVKFEVENLSDGQIRLKSTEMAKYLSLCKGCIKDGTVADFIVFSAVNGETKFELWKLMSGKYALLNRMGGFKSNLGHFVTRCNGCSPGAAYPDQVTAHALDPSEAFAQWTIEVVN